MQLTKAEEQIMQILWKFEKATVQDIRDKFPAESVPARTTVATVLSILESKEFVTHETIGRVNSYKAIVTKDSYSKKQLFGFMKNYFGGSFSNMASFFAKEMNLSIKELNDLLEETKQNFEKEN